MAIIFGLSLFPLMAMVGAAVDYSTAANMQSKLQSTVDAAALAACKSTSTDSTTLQSVAQSVLNSFPSTSPPTITVWNATSNPRSINMTAQVVYNTKILKIAQVRSINVLGSSACSAGNTNLEIALVLDTTGSMGNSAGGGTTKIAAMRTAATNFVNTMFTDFTSTHVKVAVVPFAASVKLDPATWAPNNTPSATWWDLTGQSGAHWQNFLNPSTSSFTTRFDIFKKLKAAYSGWTWGGCMEALPYPYNTQDTTPSSATPNTRYVPLLAPDEIGTEQFWFGIFDLGSQDGNSTNSYMDDGSSSSGSCDNNASSNATRLGQSCKYVSPKNIHTSQNGPNWGCTSQALTQLTNNQTTITNAISTLAANGNTNIAEGLHWGWRTISNSGVFSDAVAYGTTGTMKIIVLMTDGVNTWNSNSSVYTKSDYSSYGYFLNADGSNTSTRLPSGYSSLSTDTDARNAMDQIARETCTNAKATTKNVIIYTVAFSTPGDAIDASGQQLLKDCATDASHFFLASDASSLNSSFAAIAAGIGALRITH